MDELNNNGLKKKHVGKKVIIIISIVAILFISNLGFFYLGNRFAFSGIG